VLLFALAEFELGFGVSPLIPGQRDVLEIEPVFAGIEHGSRVTTDPLEEVRRRFNVLPREPEWPVL
jgi:hypothetical protein